MVLEISESEIKEYERLKIISQLTMIREKMKLFEHKYKMEFQVFKEALSKNEEKFEEWDDYIEWTAYVASEKELLKKREEVENAQNFSIIKN